MIRLTLYGRPGCHLCDDMRAALAVLRPRHGFSLEEVDVDASPDLAQRYGTLIPVLVYAEREVCHYFLDPDALEQALANSPEPRQGNG